jgi:hypothetical protein
MFQFYLRFLSPRILNSMETVIAETKRENKALKYLLFSQIHNREVIFLLPGKEPQPGCK